MEKLFGVNLFQWSGVMLSKLVLLSGQFCIIVFHSVAPFSFSSTRNIIYKQIEQLRFCKFHSQSVVSYLSHTKPTKLLIKITVFFILCSSLIKIRFGILTTCLQTSYTYLPKVTDPLRNLELKHVPTILDTVSNLWTRVSRLFLSNHTGINVFFF